MKTLQIFFGIVVVVLFGTNAAVADLRNESLQSLKFKIDIGDASVTLPDCVFCDLSSVGGEEANSTCMMTPNGAMPNTLLELPPVVPPTDPAAGDYTSARAAIDPVSLLRAATPPAEQPLRDRSNPAGPPNPSGPTDPSDPSNPSGPTDPPPIVIVVVPEPATLVIVGIGIAGAAVVRRRWKI